MKSKEEIEQLAKQLCNIPIDLVIDEYFRQLLLASPVIGKAIRQYDGIIQGYTQCQEDMGDERKMIMETLLKIRDCKDYGNNSSTLAKELINSINKQD